MERCWEVPSKNGRREASAAAEILLHLKQILITPFFFPPLLFEAVLPLSAGAPYSALHCAWQWEHFTVNWQALLFLEEQRIPLQQCSNSRLHFTYKTRFGILKNGDTLHWPACQTPTADWWDHLSPISSTLCWLARWYPRETEVPPPIGAKQAKQTMLLHRSGFVSQQSPRKHSQAESAFANLTAFQGNTGNGLQQDKSSWWSCQCIMMSHIFSLKHSVFSNL